MSVSPRWSRSVRESGGAGAGAGATNAESACAESAEWSDTGGGPLGQLRREAKGENEKERHHQVGGGAGDDVLQSICLRMKVGISMSLRSCDPVP